MPIHDSNELNFQTSIIIHFQKILKYFTCPEAYLATFLNLIIVIIEKSIMPNFKYRYITLLLGKIGLCIFRKIAEKIYPWKDVLFMEAENISKQSGMKDRMLREQIRQKLCESLKKGAVLYLDGAISSPSKISEALIQEEHNYMADFVTDDRGYIKEIRYDSIKV